LCISGKEWLLFLLFYIRIPATDTPWYDQAHYVKLIQNSETLTQDQNQDQDQDQDQDQKDKLFFKNILKLIDLP